MNLNIISKTKLSVIVMAFVSVNMFAQITVTDADLISIGDVIYQAYDTVPASSISVGNTGPSQIWDFSTLQVQKYDTTEFIDPAGTPFVTYHPTANLCIEDDGEYIYINKNMQGLSFVGFDNIQYPQLVLPLPLTYGLNIIVGPIVIMDSVFANPGFISHSLAPAISLNPLYNQVDSINIFIESSTEFNVDAYGDVIIPMGTFDALRLKTDDVTAQDILLYCSSTITGNGSWHLMPDSDIETTSSYSWWTNDPLVKFPLVQMDIDSLGAIAEVNFMHSPATSSVSDLSTINFKIYPIPSSNKLTIDAQNDELTSLELVDLTGKVILKKEFTQSTSLDVLDIAKGMYFLDLKTAEGKFTKQIIIE